VLDLASRGTLAIQMAGGTDAVLPRAPGRWANRTVSAEIATGEWRITTGERFPGARLVVSTPTAHVEVTGTTLAVICEPSGTCVCVYEGHVQVGRDASDMVSVDHGRRRYLYADAAHTPLDDAMLPREVPALGSFCESMRPVVRRPR
jgi:ferric-dicitrate binding protein FerR (iron transport regulator)